MATQLQPPFAELTDWVRAIDPHAAHRVPLLERAGRVLAGEERATTEGRAVLADKLERWRYQRLGERFAAMEPADRALAGALDLAANDLAGRRARPPRCPREAISDDSRDAEWAEAVAALDPAVPLDEIAVAARRLTIEHFRRPGCSQRRMFLYAPLYLSSHCVNYCTYCGFRYPEAIPRKHLSVEEALAEADILTGRGFRHLLLVGGDFPRLTSTPYYAEIIHRLRNRGVEPGVEIAPQSTAAYAELATAGACGVALYQETYQEGLYARYHPRGSKASFDWRLEGLERAAEAGISRLGLGILLGLADPRRDLVAMIRHGRYLAERFPDCRLAISLPRIHEAPEGFRVPHPVDDETFVRLYCALRLVFPTAELVLSTRETPALRNELAKICITQMSAGSSTTPGGYGDRSLDHPSGEQFPVCDHRPPADVIAWLRTAGIEPVWKT